MTTDPSTNTSVHTPANDEAQPLTSDELRRCDQRFAAELVKNSNELEVLAWARRRGILPSTLREWGAALVPAQAFEHMGKTLNAGDYLRAGLIVRRRRAPLEKKEERDHKHALDSDDKDRRADLPGFRHWLAARVSWPIRDEKGQIRTFVGRWFDDQRTMSELAGDFAGDEIWFGEAASTKPAKYLGLKKDRCSRLVAGEVETEHYPIQLSPGFVTRCSGIDFSAEEETKGKKSKYAKIGDKETPIWICEGYVDGLLAAQAGVSTIALGGCETHAEQVALLVRILAPFAEFNTPIYLCLDSDPPNAHARAKHLALGAGQRGVCDLVTAIRARHPELARLIRVVDLSSSTNGGKVDLADVLQEIHVSIPSLSTGNLVDDLLSMDTWADQVKGAQAAKLRELEAAAVDADQFQTNQIPQGVPRKNWSAALEETGVASLAAHDPDLFAHRLDQICDRLEMPKADRKAWAKRLEKEAREEAEQAEKANQEDPLAKYTHKDGSIRPTYAAVYTLLRRHFGETLVFNEMTLAPSEVLSPRKPWRLAPISEDRVSDAQLWLAREGCDADRSIVELAISALALKQRVNPAKVWLSSLKPWDEVDRIPYVVSEVLGITQDNGYTAEQIDLYGVYVRKWLRSAVARAIKPGEKADCMLTFCGPEQGQGKSSFVRALVPEPEWFGAPNLKNLDRDAVLGLRYHWICEEAEVDKGSFFKDLQAWKSFLSCEADTIRPPYGRTTARYERITVLFGTSNTLQILHDSTGGRRFWCIPIKVEIRHGLLAPILEHLWAQVLKDYVDWVQRGRHKDECPWWLNEEEKRRHAADSVQFEAEDPVREKLVEWINSQPSRWITSRAAVMGAKIGAGKDGEPTRADYMRLAPLLARLGWKADRRGDQRGFAAPDGWEPAQVTGLLHLPRAEPTPIEPSVLDGIMSDS